MTTSAAVNLFEVSMVALERARQKHIKLLPHPRSDDKYPTVLQSTPKGHYLLLKKRNAQIIVVDDWRPTAGTYADLLPGYEMLETEELPSIPPGRIFIGITYRRN